MFQQMQPWLEILPNYYKLSSASLNSRQQDEILNV